MENSQSSKRGLVVGVAIAAVIALGSFVVLARPTPASAPTKLKTEAPRVELQRSAEGFQVVAEEATVQAGSVVRTGPVGSASVDYSDGSVTRVGPDSVYELVALEVGEGQRQIVGQLEVGKTFHRVAKVSGSGSKFEVRAADAVAAVRGTAFAVECAGSGGCSLKVTEGRVELRNDAGQRRSVSAGKQASFDNGGFGEVENLSDSDPWVAANSDLDPASGGDKVVAQTEPAESLVARAGSKF